MTWSSLRPEHAIERVKFDVQFAEALPKKVVELVGVRHDAKLIDIRFGPRQDQPIAKIVVGPMGPTVVQSNDVGWLSVRSAGSATEVVREI